MPRFLLWTALKKSGIVKEKGGCRNESIKLRIIKL